MIKYKLIDRGTKADIYSILDNEDKPVFLVFLSGLGTVPQKLIVNLIEKIKDRGLLKNKTSYELMKDTNDIYELKIRPEGGYRMLALRTGGKPKFEYIIISCFKKPSARKQRRFIREADQIGADIRAGLAVLDQT